MSTYLLDANVLIALTVAEHEHHVRASRWVATVERFALCAVVEGALVRFLVRLGESASVAQTLLRSVHDLPSCEFWGDAPSYVDADLAGVTGHRQVTDAYLVATAAAHSVTLATLDRALSARFPGRVTLLE